LKSSTRNILIGLGLGVGTGLFLGDKAQFLEFAADGYVRLLQMTVLPYVTVSLIAGLGSLQGAQAIRLFTRVGILTLVLWLIALAAALVMPQLFPHVQSASFFSTALVEESPHLDFISLYIPSNPFHSLANSVVPAVVLFSGFLGVALMGIERKERLIEALKVAESALARANRFALSLTPIGLFAIAALTVGTMDLEQVSRLRVYLIGYAAMCLLLSFWVLPGLVACLTPIPARRVLLGTRDALITAFITGQIFIVLPILIDRSKALLQEHGVAQSGEGSPEVIIPAFYNFPHVAKIMTLSFVLFAAWYSETQLAFSDYARLSVAGLVSLFGSANLAVPFLLDLARVPADTFHLYLAAGIVNARFGTLAAASHMITLALVGTYALSGSFRFSWTRVLRYAIVTAVLSAATLAGLGVLLRVTGPGGYDKNLVAMDMETLRPSSVKAVILRDAPPEPPQASRGNADVLAAVRARGSLRVGYFEDQLPFSYFNARGQLVGFDVEMAYTLAEELGFGLTFVPIKRDRMEQALDSAQCDLIMSGIAVTTKRASRIVFTPPYIDETLAFLVPDHRRSEFLSAEKVRAAHGLRVAVPDLPYALFLVKREFPNVETVTLKDPMDYLEGRGPSVDALVLTAERGSFLTLLYPAYSVAVPHPLDLRIPLAYPVARRDLEFARFLGTWIDLKRKDGTIGKLYDHWILGKAASAPKPHWSMLRDVLHWVD
jgi:Na+/H+-dicarboxylate symporter/ABC-type amino acid transport substrate-binding protein